VENVYITLTLAHYNQKVKSFDSCIACNIFSNGDKIEEQVYSKTYSLIEFERFKCISPKYVSVGVYINERTYHFGMA
jgi:hypothetical protein